MLASKSVEKKVVVVSDCDITVDEVKKEIMDYLTEHEHARTSDIVFDLGIDPRLVVDALNMLEEENLVEGKVIQPKRQTK
ncbi:MAG: transcriptional regulator [Nitrososphaerota archaeon]|jgi:Mn-dependent DtxR family transcriptional regulator|nr:transcriptional regulator [Nitrososphaerota archaeon]